MKINISKMFPRGANSRKDGRKLRKIIKENWEQEDTIEIDFDGIEIASIGFVDEAFGLFVADGKTPDELADKISIKNLNKEDMRLLNYCVLSREKEKRQAP